MTGTNLLIPRGTKLVGTYDSRIVQGQRRVLVAWTRLLYPDGTSMDISGMAGTDPAGYAGFAANVDEHLNKVFNSALLLSIIGAGAQLSQPQQSGSIYAAPASVKRSPAPSGSRSATRAFNSRSASCRCRRRSKCRRAISSTCWSIATYAGGAVHRCRCAMMPHGLA